MTDQTEREILEAYVRDPREAYAIFQDACHERGTAEELIVEALNKLTLRVVALEEASAGIVRDHEIRQAIAKHRVHDQRSVQR